MLEAEYKEFHVCSHLRRPLTNPRRGLAFGVLLTVLLFMCKPLAAQQQVTGRVVSAINGEPLQGVTVTVQHTNTRALTDDGGLYHITTASDAVLVFTSIGYETAEEAVRGRREVNAFLEQAESALQEVEVNAGYYTVKDRERTGSISRITAAEIAKQPVSNPLLALNGRAPGVVITQQTGVPGNTVKIQIRGQNSLRADGNDPLYIIDGVPVNSDPIFLNASGSMVDRGIDPLNTLNPQNIGSIEILKDADATAIYGSRGANGVVLITTKKGIAGKTRVDASLTSGFGKVPKLDLLSTPEYLEMREEAFRNDGMEPTALNAPDLLLWDRDRYTDWQEVLLGNTARFTDAQLSLSGGSASTIFRLNGAWRKEGMVFPGDMGHRLASVGFNISQRAFANRLYVSLAVNYGNSENTTTPQNLVLDAISLPPNAPALRNADGSLNWENSTWVNPLAALERDNRLTSENLNANSIVQFFIRRDLAVKTNLGYASSNAMLDQKTPISSYNPAFPNLMGNALWGRDGQRNWLLEPQVVYNPVFGNHRFEMLLGGTFQRNTRQVFRLSSFGYVNDALIGNTAAATTVRVAQDDYTDYRYTAAFARVGYRYAGRYLLNLTGRRDGSSRFGPNNRFATFGAVGAAWIVSSEPFAQDKLGPVSFLKLRGSYGTTGNDRIGDYGYLNIYDTDNYRNETVLVPAQLYNPDFSWEVNKKLDVELDLRLWDDRLTFTANWFRNTSSNQLVGYALPAITGFTSVQANLPATVENKGWEFQLALQGHPDREWQWRSSLNLSIPKNTLLRYPDLESSSYANSYVIGYPLSVRRLYAYTGMDENGEYTLRDVNGDGRFNIDDRTVLRDEGRKFFGALQQTVSYKGFSLALLLEVVRHEGRGSLGLTGSYPGIRINQLREVMDRWQGPENVGTYRKFTTRGGNFTNVQFFSTLNMVDASFIRLRTINIGYDLARIIDTGLSHCEIFASGQNLFTISGYPGWDAERPQISNALPALRMYTMGIRLGF